MQFDIKQPGFYGWDIGGAHLKLAYCTPTGELSTVQQYSCPLWLGIDELKKVIDKVQTQHDCHQAQHAITMTGELVDAFDNRQQGVTEILDCIDSLLPYDNCHIFSNQGWLTIDEAKKQWGQVASMNWKASAYYAASHLKQGIFIDIGSTTSDIIAFIDGQLLLNGDSDHERQISGELVYTGAIRTPLMAISQKVPLGDKLVRLAAEWFATSADIWFLLGKLSDKDIQDKSADGKPWTAQHCRQRLARMLGADADITDNDNWGKVAEYFAEQQINQLIEACEQVIKSANLAKEAPIVGAGVGRFIAAICAATMDKDYIDFAELPASSKDASNHAPAAALSLLAYQQLA